MDYAKHDTTQYTTTLDKSATLASKEIKYVQLVVGIFLYNTQVLYGTIILVLNDISSQQAASTANTMKKGKILIDYTATYLDAYLR